MTNTSVKNVLEIGNEMKYDEHVKNLLSEKILLAWISKATVTEVYWECAYSV